MGDISHLLIFFAAGARCTPAAKKYQQI